MSGFHTAHRTTRDLDLFWRGTSELAGARDEVLEALRAAGLEVDIAQSAPAFARLFVRSGEESVLVDLVADPVEAIEPPMEVGLGGTTLRIDTPHEILVYELCALLERSELRDLQDVEALLEHGGDLERALGDAPRKDSGFSPLTLSWVARGLLIESMARASGLAFEEVDRARAFRDELVDRIARLAEPRG